MQLQSLTEENEKLYAMLSDLSKQARRDRDIYENFEEFKEKMVTHHLTNLKGLRTELAQERAKRE